jgi:hypothetical protein
LYFFSVEGDTCKIPTVMAFAKNIGKKKIFFNLQGGTTFLYLGSSQIIHDPPPKKENKPEALKSLYRSPGYKKNQLVLCKNYVLQW